MTTADRWTQAVRQQLGLGRLLPLGGPRDGAWIAERAAGTLLRRAARDVPGVRLDALGIALAHPDDPHEQPVVPPPPSALPPGGLRVTARFAATASEPLPTTSARLRTALAAAARERLGLVVTDVDLRVTDLLETEAEAAPEPPAQPRRAAGRPDDPDEDRLAAAALGVPGVDRLTAVLGRPVHLTERAGGEQAALPHRHARVEIAVGAGHRALDVAREVRAAAAAALPDHVTVAVLVTETG
ncbi:nucleopolyhedrovirus P10 family protein [Streptomyces sp. NPDC085946]|uniref:nucleopolyhedrovirus P10 family protein n=1 Tax=Streptomyces sp. NPDC085946 TaxID=3365744 RepID=UPI0037D5D4E1